MFLMTPKGYINSLFVKRIEHRSRTRDGTKEWFDVAIDVDDEPHEIYDDDSFGCQVIPGTGKVVVVWYAPEDVTTEPTIGDLKLEEHDIIAWIVFPSYADGLPVPITTFGQIRTLGGVLRVVAESGGSYVSPEEERVFYSKEHLLEVALGHARAEWAKKD